MRQLRQAINKGLSNAVRKVVAILLVLHVLKRQNGDRIDRGGIGYRVRRSMDDRPIDDAKSCKQQPARYDRRGAFVLLDSADDVFRTRRSTRSLSIAFTRKWWFGNHST